MCFFNPNVRPKCLVGFPGEKSVHLLYLPTYIAQHLSTQTPEPSSLFLGSASDGSFKLTHWATLAALATWPAGACVFDLAKNGLGTGSRMQRRRNTAGREASRRLRQPMEVFVFGGSWLKVLLLRSTLRVWPMIHLSVPRLPGNAMEGD